MAVGFPRRSGISVLMTILRIVTGDNRGTLVDRADDVLTQRQRGQHEGSPNDCKDDRIFGSTCCAYVSPKAAGICQIFPSEAGLHAIRRL